MSTTAVQTTILPAGAGGRFPTPIVTQAEGDTQEKLHPPLERPGLKELEERAGYCIYSAERNPGADSLCPTTCQ